MSYINTDLIGKRIKKLINDWCDKEFPSEFRNHLGASIIGRQCEREIWYSFRWVGLPDYNKINRETGELEDHGPRMRRLFQRGHSEEDRFVSYLRGIGCEVFELDPSTGKQWNMSDCGGHFGGSLDGIAILPPEVTGLAEPMRVLVEFKTYGIKAFSKMLRYGLEEAKPEHITQMNVYGSRFQLDYSVYMGVRKDDDEIEVKFRKLDWSHGQAAIDKARRIIRLPVAPDPISTDPTNFKCAYCDYKKICHNGALPSTRNCRSCRHAYPEVERKWICGATGELRDDAAIQAACPQWTPVT